MDALHQDRAQARDAATTVDASYHLILDHVFLSPGASQRSPRSNYALTSSQNSNPLATQQSLRSPTTPLPSTKVLNMSSTRSRRAQRPPDLVIGKGVDKFKTALLNHCANLPSQSCSLTPPLVAGFLKACFPLQLEFVDFPQALDGLNYLKEIGLKLRREVTFALSRAGSPREIAGSTLHRLTDKCPGIVKWRVSVLSREHKVEILETQLFMSLRRWILINEMSMKPYNKHNALAMLNILFPLRDDDEPPSPSTKPPPAVMKSQREIYFRYIQSVERKGCHVLQPLMQFGKPQKSSDETGWPIVSRTLDIYLRAALGLIDECTEVQGAFDFDLHGLRSYRVTGFRRRNGTDIGAGLVSPRGPTHDGTAMPVGESRRTSDAQDAQPITPSRKPVGKYLLMPLSPQQPVMDTSRPASSQPEQANERSAEVENTRRLSALEKIAREIRKIRERRKTESSKCDGDKIDHDDTDPSSGSSSLATSPASTFSAGSGAQRIRRLRSLGDIKDGRLRGAKQSDVRTANTASIDDLDEMAKRRQQSARQEMRPPGLSRVGLSFEA